MLHILNDLAAKRYDSTTLKDLQRMADDCQIICHVSQGRWTWSVLDGQDWRRSAVIYRSKRAALVAALLEVSK